MQPATSPPALVPRGAGITTKLLLALALPTAGLAALAALAPDRGLELLARSRAEAVGRVVAHHLVAARRQYTESVVARVGDSPHAPATGPDDAPDEARVPTPAAHVRGIAAGARTSGPSFSYRFVDRWGGVDGRVDPAMARAVAALRAQAETRAAAGTSPGAPLDPVVEEVAREGRRHLRIVVAETASSAACVSCHDAWEARDDVRAARRTAGQEEGRVHGRDEVLGAVAVEVDIDEALAPLESWTNGLTAAAAGLGAVILLVAGVFVRAQVVGPVAAATGRVEALRDGRDTTHAGGPSDAAGDELGELHRSLGRLAAGLGEAAQGVAGNAESLADAVGELGGASARVESKAGRAADEAARATTTAGKVTRSISEVARAADEVGASVVEISESAQTAEREATSAVALVAAANERVGRLGESSREIANALDLIEAIAEQTSLVALNASIEAARAGASGRGFAVVANEVKDLSRSTAHATAEIGERIAAIQTDTRSVVEEIGKIRVALDRVRKLQATIAAAVHQQSAQTSGIGRSVTEASTGSEDFAASVERVRDDTHEAAAGAREIAATARELTQLAANLRRTANAPRG